LSMSCPSSSWLMKRSRKKIGSIIVLKEPWSSEGFFQILSSKSNEPETLWVDLLVYLSVSANSFLSICLQISVEYKWWKVRLKFLADDYLSTPTFGSWWNQWIAMVAHWYSWWRWLWQAATDE
jgi:hypothetical protein